MVLVQEQSRLEFIGSREDIFIEADKDRINQVISNLLSNAIKFTNKGTISITSDAEPTNIESPATNPSKIRKITLAMLIVAVSLSVAIEIGYAKSLAQGYTSSTDSYKQTLCIGKVQDLSQKGIIRDMGGFSGAIYECTHTKYTNSIYGDVLTTLKI